MNKQKIHILLAEDDDDDCLFFQEAINAINVNFLITVVNNGEKAVNYFKDTKVLPDFVFLDINMPIMNGIESLKAIKQIHPSNDLHVVMLSTSMSDEMVDKSYRYGASLYIQKPTSIKDLANYLTYCFDNLRNTAVQQGFVLNHLFKTSL